MSYVVLARKHRPQTFDEVIGQEPITRTLKNALAQGRVHHAYLLCGSRGVGKTTTARVLAKALNCDSGPTPEPCGKCVSCEEIRAGTAVDVIEIDGASHTGVDDVRELCESVRYMPARGRRKIYIIDEVHMFSPSAFNALLKTLEEPPPHVVFVFATTEPHKLPATILSRCQRFDFRRLTDARLREHLRAIVLREGLRVDDGGLSLIARASEGGVRDALSLLDQVVAYAGGEAVTEAQVAEVLGVADRRSLLALADAVLGRDAGRALGVLEEVFRAGHDLGRFAAAFLSHLRDLAVAASVDDPGPLLDMSDGERRDVLAQASRTERARALSLFERFARATEEVLRAQSPKVVLEVALLDLLDAEPLLPLGDLLDRLESLEGRLAGAAASGAPGAATPSLPRPTTAPESGGSRAQASIAPRPQPIAPLAAAAAPGSWRALIDDLGAQNPRLAGIYALAKPLRFDEGEIVLGLPAGSLELEIGSERARDLEAFVSARSGGRPVRVRIEAAAPDAPAPLSVAEVEEGKQQAEREKRRREAIEHPTIRAAVDILGGDVRNVRTE
ncbi:MAG: DNA polymerase III subunit gamma/tau [Myxococcota bacterium]